MLFNGREKVRIENLKNPKAFFNYAQKVDDAYENLEDHNPIKKRGGRGVLIVFDDMITDMKSNKMLSPVVTELFLRGTKLKFSLFFISKPFFKLSKTIRLNATHYFIMKIPNKKELQEIV